MPVESGTDFPLASLRERLAQGQALAAAAGAVACAGHRSPAQLLAAARSHADLVATPGAVRVCRETEAIAVRGLSLSHDHAGRLLLGELRTGVLLGASLGVLSAAGAWLWLGDARLALALGLALLAAGTVASTIGYVFPWLLARLGRDPAYGSGPLATVIQDVLSLAIYFATVTALAR